MLGRQQWNFPSQILTSVQFITFVRIV